MSPEEFKSFMQKIMKGLEIKQVSTPPEILKQVKNLLGPDTQVAVFQINPKPPPEKEETGSPLHIIRYKEEEPATPNPLQEAGCKFQAKISLLNQRKAIIVPTIYEWFGLGMLERDDELKRRK